MSSLSCAKKNRQKVFNLNTSTVSSCCRAYPESLSVDFELKNLITQWQLESIQLDQGVKVASCNGCWKDEEQNQISYRQLEPEYNNDNFEIVVSNLCNHMCSYCSPMFSSEWQNSIQQQGKFVKIPLKDQLRLAIDPVGVTPDHFLSQFEQYLETVPDNSVTVRLLGGEPLMQADALRRIFLLRPDKISSIDIITNLNPPSPKFLEWILETQQDRLNRLNFKISIDATPQYNHVVRAGFDQTKFESNLKLIQHHGIAHTIYATVSLLSVFDLPNFIQYINANQFEKYLTLINDPASLNPKNVPRSIRQTVLNTTHAHLPKSIVEMLNAPDPSDIELLASYHYVNQYFGRTNQDPTKIFNPLFQEFWKITQNRLDNWLT